MYGVAAATGAVCALLLCSINVVFSVPESVAQLTWAVVVLCAAFVCGWLSPVRAWRWGAVIIGIQPLAVFILFLLIGEITNPSTSTGGLAAVMIFSLFMVPICPLAALVSQLGGWARLVGRPKDGVAP